MAEQTTQPEAIGDPIHIYDHPQFERWEMEWIKTHDFLRGGMHVLKPAAAVTQVAFLRTEKDDAGEERRTYDAQLRQSYLFSHTRESFWRWEDRNRRAEHMPVFRPIVNIFGSALYQTAPTRTIDGKETLPERWESYLADVDMRGTGINAFSEGRARWTLAFGRSHALTDVVSVDEPPVSLAEQEALGIRAYSTAMTPLAVPNWSVDAYGQYRWAVFAEEADEGRQPDSEPSNWDRRRRRIWTPEEWTLYAPHVKDDKPTGMWVPIKTGVAPGLVPLSTFYADKAEAAAERESDSPLASILGVDLAVFNLLSQLDETELLSCFNQLVMEGDGGDRDTGEATILYYSAGEKAPQYIAPPDETARGKWERIIARIHLASEQALSGRGRAAFSKEERSAEALGVEYQDRYAMLTSLAGSAEDAEEEQFRHVAAWNKATEYPRSVYQKRFDFRSISQQVMDALGMVQLPIGAEAKAATLERLVDRVLKAQGTPEEVRRVAVTGIKEAVQEAAELAQKALAQPAVGLPIGKEAAE